jgi:site-specific DNA-methyltransferase (adenine-specific)
MLKNGNNGYNNISLDYAGSHGALFRADCLQLLANIRENTIDMVYVDPPFNLNKDYAVSEFDDNMETEAYRSWCRAWLLELTRVLKPGGALFLYHWPKWLIDLGAWLNTLPALEYKSWIALKMKGGFPIKGRLHPAHYGMLYYVKKGAKPTFNVVRAKSPTCRHCGKLIRDYGGYRNKFKKYEDEDGVPWIQVSDFWEDTRPARQDKSRKQQINELPLHVPERAILMASKPHDIILDCFGGGGSTFQAAQLHNRFWIGCELGEPTAILRRIATVFGSQEIETVKPQIAKCFTPGFRAKVLNKHKLNASRPILKVEPLDEVVESMNEEASKSKVLGF